ncbi:helix-turn-helix domain-containing protein [Desertivirga arenae]|uniref:helix-turn-helix domain-containing protein n=1 Tax=Desertivirga arenae TaxID=2810309 RepID=UPI001A97D218|nr:AraC family transcriptional regulator [Pedobacter sp. SYSU D00823]
MPKKILKHSFSLLHADHVKLDRKWNYSNVVSPYYRLYYIDDGEGYISDQKQTIKLEPGYLYIIPSFTLCSLQCERYLSQYFIQFFEDSADGISLFANNRTTMKVEASILDSENFKRLLFINPGRGINRSDNPRVYEKSIYYKQYQELNNLQSLASYMETQGILLQLISRFLTTKTFRQSTSATIPSKILDSISYIQLNLGKNLTVAHLAERANQHPDYFSRLFLRSTGDRPIAFINEKRIERAQYLLTTTKMPSEEVALETGFENVPYFSKIFKKITGLTPGQYKEQNCSSRYS